ncbi:amidase family protein [Pararhodobacter zhoushanensis]|uniref:Amidase family protein n=1 Tax=Pararhodobacter zhoushanensis TaxID=2479545 RepID=A0ABT3GX95_9RHOB|nr:amidase family protein [Pararhodobacter zhoushanensis]MCW1404200.1 amidase family protein [Novosphingobium sp. MW5]MCW1932169.1 amidase family protein [Pararhodobacter zhoushanensis]
MTDTPLWQLSATELSALTRAGDVSAVEATQAAIDRMHAVNPGLNAVVVDLSEAALARARTLDASDTPKGSLHGVPITIKINVDQKGQASSNGLLALKDHSAGEDAPLVKNLLDAGAIIIGRTNTPEFSFRVDTDNPLHGRTHNPWGPHLSAGGSSGGAGSAVAAGIGALAHGNDIAGSLRYPASANGAVTVKPGLGRVPAWNPSQPAERGMLAQAMSVQGLITRSARDLALAMPAMIRPDPRDPFHVPLPWKGAAQDGPVKVGFTTETLDFPLHPEVAAALTDAREALTDAGYVVEDITPPALRDLADCAIRALMTETQAMMAGDIQRLGSDTVKGIFAEYFATFQPYEPEDYLRTSAKRTHFARQWSLLLHDYPLVLTPFLPQPFFAPGRDAQGPEGVQEVLGSAIWSTSMNFIGLPAGNVPARLAALDSGTQPIGVQIVGRRWREDLIVEAMTAIEERVGPMAPRLWSRMG